MIYHKAQTARTAQLRLKEVGEWLHKATMSLAIAERKYNNAAERLASLDNGEMREDLNDRVADLIQCNEVNAKEALDDASKLQSEWLVELKEVEQEYLAAKEDAAAERLAASNTRLTKSIARAAKIKRESAAMPWDL